METDQFMIMMFWTFGEDSAFDLFRKLKAFDMSDSIDKIQCKAILVMNSVHDQTAGSYEQSKKFYKALTVPKTYVEFSTAEGAQFHCQLGAPMISSERMLNWLDDKLQKKDKKK